MFKEYIIADPYQTVSSAASNQLTGKYKIIVKDTEFEEVIEAQFTDAGLDIITPLTKLYEDKKTNVAANIAAYCVYSASRFGVKPDVYFKRVKYLNASYQKYEKDIEKYLQLI